MEWWWAEQKHKQSIAIVWFFCWCETFRRTQFNTMTSPFWLWACSQIMLNSMLIWMLRLGSWTRYWQINVKTRPWQNSIHSMATCVVSRFWTHNWSNFYIQSVGCMVEVPIVAMVPWPQMVCVKLVQKLNVRERWTCHPKPAGHVMAMMKTVTLTAEMESIGTEKRQKWWEPVESVEKGMQTAKPTSSSQIYIRWLARGPEN